MLSSICSAGSIKFSFKGIDYNLSGDEYYDNFFVMTTGYWVLVFSFSNINFNSFSAIHYSNDGSAEWTSDASRFSFLAGNGGCYVTRSMFRTTTGELSSSSTTFYEEGKGATFSAQQGFIFSTFDIKDKDGNIFFKGVGKNPFIVNRDEICTGNFKSLVINTGDFSIEDNLTLSVNELRPIQNGSDFTYYLNKTKKFDLDSSMEGLTLTSAAGTNSVFSIPSSKFFVFQPGYKYEFIIKKGTEELCYESFVCGEVSVEDKEQQEKDKQLEMQEEQNKTNKGIWDTLKEVLSFINPLSENFFVYKLIELLINAIKSLFIPSDDFFTTWINNMNDWLSDRLGALYYPVDLVTEFLDRIGDISENGSAVISGNGFEFMGAQLIPAFSYDLNSLLTNDTFKNIHDIYLTVVDVILYLCLIVLAKNTFTDIFGGKYDDGVDIAMQGLSSDGGYKRYESYQNNKKRYKREHGG